jgi:hypothetical protein
MYVGYIVTSSVAFLAWSHACVELIHLRSRSLLALQQHVLLALFSPPITRDGAIFHTDEPPGNAKVSLEVRELIFILPTYHLSCSCVALIDL